MGAREKLNAAYLAGSLLTAAIAGALTGSFAVFIIAAVILVALNVQSGEIRPGKHR